MKTKLISFLFLLAIPLFFFTCEKEETATPESPNGYPIELFAVHNKDDNTVSLSWNNLNLPSFNEYILVHSTDSISDLPNPSSHNNGGNQLLSISDQDDTSLVFQYHTISNFPLSETLYFKLYIKLDDRHLLSPSIAILPESTLIDGVYNHAVKVPGTPKILIATKASQVRSFDYAKGIIEASTSVNIGHPKIRVGDAGNGLEAFVFSRHSNDLIILDPNDLSIKDQLTLGGGIYDIAISKKGLIFAAVIEEGKALTCINRGNLQTTDVANTTIAPGYSRSLVLLNPDDTKLYELMAHRASIIEFNDQGILTPSISEDYSTLLSNNKEVTISPSRDEYIHTSHTRVYNPDLQEVITYSMISLHQLFDSQNENIIYFLDSSKRIMKLDRSAGNISEFFDHRTEYILDAGDQIIAITEGHDFEFTGTLITTLDK